MSDDALPEDFWRGVEQFNQHQFYDCHDTLEALWMEAGQPDKTFYQGILQISVAFYHLGNHNWRGAVILLGEGDNRLRPYLPEYGGINLEDFLTQTAALLSTLQTTGPDQVGTIVHRLGYPTVPNTSPIHPEMTATEEPLLALPKLSASAPRPLI
jgi:predicted metal-dependent hydrolase